MTRSPVGNEDGATAVEYGFMLALLSIAILVAVIFLADEACDMHEANGRSIEQQAVVTADGGGCAGLAP